MVGQRLQKYIAGFGLEAGDVPTVITTFLRISVALLFGGSLLFGGFKPESHDGSMG